MRNVLVAIAIAVAVGAGAVYLTGRPSPKPQPVNTGVVNAPEAPSVDPAAYLAAFPLAPPDVPSVTGTSPQDRALEKALAPMRRGDYAGAATALDGLLIDHPGEPRAQLYLGIARLFQDEPQNALELLRPLEFNAPPDVAAEAAWYSLVGIARLRDPSHVESEADRVCTSSLPTAPRACRALANLTKARAK
jgi:hypothetical protein